MVNLLALPSLMFFAVLLFLGCASAPTTTLPVVPELDMDRYTGTWHEIARYEHRFQKGCTQSKATYARKSDTEISVTNECLVSGKRKSATGKAWIVDPATPAKLKVSFFWPFRGDYWVIDLGTDYEYAVISEPKKKYLWILSRTPGMEPEQLANVESNLRALGFDLSNLRYETTD